MAEWDSVLFNRWEGDSKLQLSAKITHQDQKETLIKSIMDADVFIDFTKPAATMNHLALCLEYNTKMVIGTTGFSNAEVKLIQESAKKLAIVLSPNMSIGINLMFKLLSVASHLLQNSADIAILDIHHKHKKDAPSGTALKMLEIISASQKSNNDNNIEISSFRIGEVKGEHAVLFALPDEEIKINHIASDRRIFARGACEAAKWLVNQEAGLYDMQDVLGLR